MRVMTAATAVLLCLAGADAAAQTTFQAPAPSRGFISANGIYQATSSSFDDRLEFQEFVEKGTIETSFESKPAIGLDGSVGIRVWRNLGLGAGITTYAPGSRNDGGGTVTARIPHPFHFNQHREVTGDAGLRRKETAIHANLLYFIPSRSKLQVIIGGGASYFQAEQSFVNDVLYDQEYPYDTATFRGVDIDNESASGLGFNAMVDVSWRFARSFGAGGVVRYTHGSLPFTPGERELNVDVGGVQAGIGLRVIF